ESGSIEDLMHILDAGHPVILLLGGEHGGDGHYYVIQGYFTNREGEVEFIERDGLIDAGTHGMLTAARIRGDKGQSQYYDNVEPSDLRDMNDKVDKVMPWRTQEYSLSNSDRLKQFQKEKEKYTLANAPSLLEVVPQSESLTETERRSELTMELV